MAVLIIADMERNKKNRPAMLSAYPYFYFKCRAKNGFRKLSANALANIEKKAARTRDRHHTPHKVNFFGGRTEESLAIVFIDLSDYPFLIETAVSESLAARFARSVVATSVISVGIREGSRKDIIGKQNAKPRTAVAYIERSKREYW